MTDEPLTQEELKQKIQEMLDDMINPAVAGHGGFIRLLDVRDNRVFMQMGGGCQGCGMANITLRNGVETLLREEFPQIEAVIDQTEHADGLNPYYRPPK